MNFLRRKIDKAFRVWQSQGWRGLRQRAGQKIFPVDEAKEYQKWIERSRLTDADYPLMRRRIENFSYKPFISLVLPVYNVEEKWLRLCIESVLKQIYPVWELCIADDFSPAAHIRPLLEEYAARDSRIKVVFRPENGHISAASNSALALATGEFCAFLDHDDELTEDALYFVAEEINGFPDADLIYTDEDMVDESGRRFMPNFKPDWSADLFYSLNLITHLSVYRTDILKQIGGFRTGVEGSQDYDLALRVIERISPSKIRHIPRILYHWRAIPGSIALSPDQKNYAHEAARRAISEHFECRNVQAKITAAFDFNYHRVVYSLPTPAPVASLILAHNQDAFSDSTIRSLLEKTDYPDFEMIIIKKNQGDFSADSRMKIVSSDLESEAARLNFAAEQATGEVLVFLDPNLQPLNPNWLREMVSHAVRPEIGACGAKLLYRDESVRHAGYILGVNGLLGDAHHRFPRNHPGYFARALLINNFSAVSGACFAVRRELFERSGGFDAANLPNQFYDADFCLRLGEAGFRTVWTPYAELISNQLPKRAYGGKNHKQTNEIKYFQTRWREKIRRDPFYNPNLTGESEDFSRAASPPERADFLRLPIN